MAHRLGQPWASALATAVTFGLTLVLTFTQPVLAPVHGLAAAETDEPVAPQVPDHNFVATAVGRVAPAVVRIDTERHVQGSGLNPMLLDPLLRDTLGDLPSTPISSMDRVQGW